LTPAGIGDAPTADAPTGIGDVAGKRPRCARELRRCADRIGDAPTADAPTGIGDAPASVRDVPSSAVRRPHRR